jgi:hypothetical protein
MARGTSVRRSLRIAALSLALASATLAADARGEAGESSAAGPARAAEAPRARRSWRNHRAWTLAVGTGAGGLPELSDGLVRDDAEGLAGLGSSRGGRLQAHARADREWGRWVRTGLAYTHQRWRREYFDAAGEREGELRASVHVLLADLTVRWIRGRDVELYSAAGAGGALWSESGTVAGDRHARDAARFAFQLRALGLSLGGEHVRAFAEVGLGYEGLLVGGIAVRI